MIRSISVLSVTITFAWGLTMPSNPQCSEGVHTMYTRAFNKILPSASANFPLLAQVSDDAATSSTTSTKVREMATFLSMKLLEKAVAEIAKDDDKSHMTEEDILKLAEALQAPDSSENVPGATITPEKSSEDGSAEVPEEATSTIATISTASEDVQDTLRFEDDEILKKETETETDGDTLEIKTASKDAFQRSLLEAQLMYSAKGKSKSSTIEIESISPIPETGDPSPLADSIGDIEIKSSSVNLAPRFPDIISKDFGKPLEVEASNVPALREEAKPKKQTLSVEASVEESIDCKSDQLLIDSPLSTTSALPSSSPKKDAPSPAAAQEDMPESAPEDILVKTNDSADSIETLEEAGQFSTSTTGEDSSAPSQQGDEEKDDGKTSIPELSKSESTSEDLDDPDVVPEIASQKLAESPVDANQPIQSEMVPGAATTSSTDGNWDGDTTDDTIPAAGLASTEEDEEEEEEDRDAVLAQKYASIPSLEDRAYAILSDLGMARSIKINSVAREVAGSAPDSSSLPPQSGSDSPSAVAAPVAPIEDRSPQEIAPAAIETAPTAEDGDPDEEEEAPPAGLLGSVRNLWKRSRSLPLWSRESTAPVSAAAARSQKFGQPRSPSEEAKLAQKYAAMEDVGDRAFCILRDLEMV